MLLNLPIPVKTLDPPLNGRSTLIRLWSSGPVYAASLAKFADQKPDGSEQAPTLEEWQTLLENGNLAGPRETPPTPLDVKKGRLLTVVSLACLEVLNGTLKLLTTPTPT